MSDASYKVLSKSDQWFMERRFLKRAYGSHLDHVTSIMLMFFYCLYLQAYNQNLAENGPVVTDKTSLSFIFK